MSDGPFGVLGLPVRPDLTDDDVRAAWRRIAAATHPDRDDGGDPERFAAAAAAYTELRTRFGRGEAYADLTSPGRGHARPVIPPDPVPPGEPVSRSADALVMPAGAGRRPGSAARLMLRIRRGRPALLALRLAIAAGLSAASFTVVGAQPPAGGLTIGAVTWFLLTARRDLAPPGS
jgi:curved DNA-binding protein CbpA